MEFVGQGEPSVKFPFITQATSKPSKLRCESIAEDKLKFTWQNPLEIGNGVAVDNFNYNIKPCASKDNCQTGKNDFPG